MRVSGHITSITPLAKDVYALHIRPRTPFLFAAGQYVRLGLNSLPPRAYSIASSPHRPDITLHIRNTGGGMSATLVNENMIGKEVVLEGPFGTPPSLPCPWPLLLLAGGVGIAPIHAMIETIFLEKPIGQPVSLIWGARAKDDLYLHDYFQSLASAHSFFSYIPVLEEKTEGYPTGLITDQLGQIKDIADCSTYIAGPDKMVAALMPVLLQKGVQKELIFSDGFGV